VIVDFDYVIVGAGAAGCVLANRLSENPENRVLLLEYGGRDTNPMLYVPKGGPEPTTSLTPSCVSAVSPGCASSTPPSCPSSSPATLRPPPWRSPGSPPTSSSTAHRQLRPADRIGLAEVWPAGPGELAASLVVNRPWSTPSRAWRNPTTIWEEGLGDRIKGVSRSSRI